MENEKVKAESKDVRKAIGNIRNVQGIFLGIFTLGISMMTGDYASFIHSPISTLSMTTTVFGLMGTIVTEFMARKAVNW